MLSIKNVTIGDKFKQGKNIICEVVDFEVITSMSTGLITGHRCIAKSTSELCTNTFDVPFATVVRNRC